MSNFIKILIKSKLKQLTTNDLIYYANEYGFGLTKNEANHISIYLKSNDIDPFNEQDRQKAFDELTKITNISTAKKAERLFYELIQEYGLDYLFN